MELGRVLALAMIVSGSLPPVTHAQDEQDEQSARGDSGARRLFERGVSAMDEGRLEEARELLRDSLRIEPHPPTAFNLAVVLSAMGETVEAVNVASRLLEGAFGAISGEPREEVVTLMHRLRAEVGRIEVHANGASHIDVRIDGHVVGSIEERGVQVAEVDHGTHAIDIAAPDGRTERATVQVARGATARVELTLPPPIEADEGGVFSSPWFWIVAGIVAIGAGAAAAVLIFTADRTQDPLMSPDFPIVEALRP